MPKKAMRLGDLSSGACGLPPKPTTSASPNVLINNKGAVRVGDSYATHKRKKKVHAGRTASSGSGTVFINGKPAHRSGDGISCGDKAGSGSDNVLIGG